LSPEAYPKIGQFIYDSGLQVRETFVATIAPMVLVGTERPAPAFSHNYLSPSCDRAVAERGQSALRQLRNGRLELQGLHRR